LGFKGLNSILCVVYLSACRYNKK